MSNARNKSKKAQIEYHQETMRWLRHEMACRAPIGTNPKSVEYQMMEEDLRVLRLKIKALEGETK